MATKNAIPAIRLVRSMVSPASDGSWRLSNLTENNCADYLTASSMAITWPFRPELTAALFMPAALNPVPFQVYPLMPTPFQPTPFQPMAFQPMAFQAAEFALRLATL